MGWDEINKVETTSKTKSLKTLEFLPFTLLGKPVASLPEDTRWHCEEPSGMRVQDASLVPLTMKMVNTLAAD